MIPSLLSITTSTLNSENNHGTAGGGIALYEHSKISCHGMCNLYFSHNMAVRRGGAIYIKYSVYINAYIRVLNDFPLASYGEFVLNFSSNTAALAGDDIYGGWIDIALEYPLLTLFQGNSSTTVTSDPTHICLCSNSVPDCNIIEHSLMCFPGETFEIEAVAVGRRIGIVPSIISIIESPNEDSLGLSQDVQSGGRQCTTLQLTINTLRFLYKLQLRAQGAGTPKLSQLLKENLPQKFHILFQRFNIKVILKPCPLGYEISQILKKCLCSDIIESHSGVGCHLENYTVIRSKHHWLHATTNASDSAIIIALMTIAKVILTH